MTDTRETLMTPREVATLFGVNTRVVTHWAVTGCLGYVRTPGGHRRYRASEVQAQSASLARRAAAAHHPGGRTPLKEVVASPTRANDRSGVDR